MVWYLKYDFTEKTTKMNHNLWKRYAKNTFWLYFFS